ncbi:MAG: Gfo/Idh/MocA family oxidoreductase [Acidobacteria bacterium]|nr:MAG: Gfo/Idh/MocA family oxidoreductase [Acidobacteriota bacterium]
MKEIRVGLIGLGIHGARYAHHLETDVPGALLAAVCRQDRVAGEAFADRRDVAFFSDFRLLMDSGQVDAVCAVVPPDLHVEIAEAAAAAGVALLLEKPLAVDVACARRILQASSNSAAAVMVAHTLRYNPVVLRVRELMAGLGRIHLIAVNQRFEPASRPWLDRPGPGGIILNTGIHEFDLVRFVTHCEIRSVRCLTRRVGTRRTEDVFAAVMELEPGEVLATVDASRHVGGRSGRIEVAGADGQIVADHAHSWVSRLSGRTSETYRLNEEVPTVRETLVDFVRLVRGEIDNPIPVLEGARAVAVAEACLRSASTGREEKVELLQ